ncbi:hypothetical protein [Yoonia sp. 2307UL14-13]|uniref:hypothetical protein n=1 Tax=Yoonia sp. 2307UL14-13 TaxID=3126506 RepID=UPI00309893A9
MAQSYLDKVANELADLALADQAASGDIAIVDQVGEVLGASSQILQETYNTAIRVRRAEARARELLAARKAKGFKLSPKPALPSQDVLEDAEIVETTTEEVVTEVTEETSAPEEISATKTFEEAKARARAEAEAKAQAEAEAKAKAAAAAKAAEEAAKAKSDKPKPKAVPAPWDLDGLDVDDSSPAADNKPAAPRRVTR